MGSHSFAIWMFEGTSPVSLMTSIAAFPWLPMLLRTMETSEEEERFEHEADCDRDGAVVFPIHACKDPSKAEAYCGAAA